MGTFTGGRSVVTTLVTTEGIQLGHESDTSIDRVSAGVVSIEGVTIATASNTLTLTGKSIAASQITAATFAAGSFSFVGSTIGNLGTVTTANIDGGTIDGATIATSRVNKRTTTEVSSATPTINTDNTDIHTITALAVAITSMTTNLSGTPVNGQTLIIRILDNGTARAITWGASFASRGATLPTTTTISKYLRAGFEWNSTTSTWDCVATAEEA